MSTTQSANLIRNEQELLSATGTDSATGLADSLWEDVDGVVHFFDEGIDLQPGIQHEGLSYPFTLQELRALALSLEESEVLLQYPVEDTVNPSPVESEVPLQAAAGKTEPSKARLAQLAHHEFAPEAARQAEKLLGAGYRLFAPRAMTTFAWWYEDDKATQLVAVVAPTEVLKVADDVLAYALAWQGDRELTLVLSDKHSAEVGRRLPWIDAPVTIRSLEGRAVEMSQLQVLTNAAALQERSVKPHIVDAERTAWIAALLGDGALDGLEAHARASYLSWHHHGLQLLRVTAVGSGGLRLEAGVQHNRPQPDHKIFNTMLTGPLTDEQHALVLEALAGSVASGSLTSRQTEHRLQASIGISSPPPLGLPHLAREYPGYRGPGRPGFIDFLGCDKRGNLHIVETKVGHDPKVVLQALDYGIWLRANDQSVRDHRPDWPRPDTPQTEIFLDFVLAAGDDATAVSSYLAGQLDVLAVDVHWRVFVVQDLNAHPVVLTQVPPEELWTSKAGVTSEPVRPRRSTTLA